MVANEKKEVLRLAVPRRHILAAGMCVSDEEARPTLQHICFRPQDDGEIPAQRGGLLTIATNGYKLVELTGGEWEGEWPLTGVPELCLLPNYFSRKKAKKVLDTNVEVRLFDDGGFETIDETAGHHFEGRRHVSPYPDTAMVVKKYGSFAIARDMVNLDARYLEDMGKIGAMFSDKTARVVGILLRRRKVKDGMFHPVFTMEATSVDLNRSMKVLLMGTRDVR